MSGGMDGSSIASDSRGERCRRWIRLALIGSIALNLFFVGVVGVWAVKPLWRDRPGGPGPVAGGIAERMVQRLPDADKPILGQALQKRQDDIRRLLDEARAAQQDARRSLRANTFDPSAFSAASDRTRAARDGVQAAIHQAVREAATTMSREGRAKLAQPPRPPRGN